MKMNRREFIRGILLALAVAKLPGWTIPRVNKVIEAKAASIEIQAADGSWIPVMAYETVTVFDNTGEIVDITPEALTVLADYGFPEVPLTFTIHMSPST